MFNKKLVTLVIMLLFGGYVYACMLPHEGESRGQRQEPQRGRTDDRPWCYHVPPSPDWFDENDEGQLPGLNQVDSQKLSQVIVARRVAKESQGLDLGLLVP